MDNDENEKSASNQMETEHAKDSIMPVESEDAIKESVQKKPKKNFLIVYALTLLAVAFGLVLMSYFNEIRMNNEEVVRLKEEKEQYSISAMKDLQNLQDENGQLNLQVEELITKITEQAKINEELVQEKAELEKKYANITDVVDKSIQEKNKLVSQQAAIEAMMYIDQQYSGGKYSRSAYEISKLENGNSAHIAELFANQENGPMITKVIDRYMAVRKWLEGYGYMDPSKISKWAEKNNIK